MTPDYWAGPSIPGFMKARYVPIVVWLVNTVKRLDETCAPCHLLVQASDAI